MVFYKQAVSVMFRFFRSLAVLAILALPMNHATAESQILPDLSVAHDQNMTAQPEKLVKLATKYEHAEGVPRDYSMAIKLYCEAAKLGNANAQYALGWMYANGRGIPKDDSVAAQLFMMAAEQGHAHAQNMTRYTKPSAASALPSCLLPEKEIAAAAETGIAEENSTQEAEAVYRNGPIFKLVNQLAPEYQVDPKLALAVISVESGFNVRALSPKNAQGLMQLIPETARRFRVKDAFDAKENIKGGLAYLQWLLAYFKGNVPLVAAAYNSGERTVEKYRGIPPYPETQEYVRKIAQLYRKTDHPYRLNLVKASPVTLPSASLGN